MIASTLDFFSFLPFYSYCIRCSMTHITYAWPLTHLSTFSISLLCSSFTVIYPDFTQRCTHPASLSLELQFSLILCTPSRRSKQIMATIQVPPSPCPTKHWCDISTALSAQPHCANYVGRQPQEQTSPCLTCDAKEILCWQVKEHKKAKKNT